MARQGRITSATLDHVHSYAHPYLVSDGRLQRTRLDLPGGGRFFPSYYYRLLRDELRRFPHHPAPQVAAEVELAFGVARAQLRQAASAGSWVRELGSLDQCPRASGPEPSLADIRRAVAGDVDLIGRALGILRTEVEPFEVDPGWAPAEVHAYDVCGRCGRGLTGALSMQTGFGPECRRIMGIETDAQIRALAKARAGLRRRLDRQRLLQDERRLEATIDEIVFQSTDEATVSDEATVAQSRRSQRQGGRPDPTARLAADIARARLRGVPLTRQDAERAVAAGAKLPVAAKSHRAVRNTRIRLARHALQMRQSQQRAANTDPDVRDAWALAVQEMPGLGPVRHDLRVPRTWSQVQAAAMTPRPLKVARAA